MTVRVRNHTLPVSGGDTLHAIELWPDDRSPESTLVFSHGAGGSHLNWYHQAAHFGATHRVILWDHRGFGRSTNRMGLASPRTAASDLEAVITEVAGGRAYVIAQSMGGWAALALAARRPELFRGLVLSDSCAGLLSATTVTNLEAFAAGSADGADQLLGSLAVGREYARARPTEAVLYNLLVKALPSAYPTAVRDLVSHPFDGDLTRLTGLPVKAVVGSEDQIFPPDVLERDLAAVPGITFSVIEGAGHSPYVESPTEFNQVLAEFLGRSSCDPRPLVDALPAGLVITDPDGMAGYRWDRAQDPDAGMPLAVVRATCTADVQTAVRFCAENNLPVVTRGAGTGLSGGSTAIDGCVVISTERMRAIEVDPRTRTCTVEPGLLNAEVKAAVAEHGLWYPPDPSSFEICSIGGNIATNAGGLCCVKYGVTSEYVLGMTVVLADGTAVELGGALQKDVAGLPLTKLFVGSEGTLGIVTRVVLRLLPAQRAPATLVATFAALDEATASVLGITRTMRPSMLEFMDKASINAVEDVTRMGLDRGAEAMLVVQSDESAGSAAAELEAVRHICETNGAAEVFSTDDPAEGEAFVAARRIAIPAVERRGSLLLEDVGVPLPRLGDLVRGIEDIAAERDVEIAVIAHAGDGNTHPLIVCDATDPDQMHRARLAYGEVMELAIALGEPSPANTVSDASRSRGWAPTSAPTPWP